MIPLLSPQQNKDTKSDIDKIYLIINRSFSSIFADQYYPHISTNNAVSTPGANLSNIVREFCRIVEKTLSKCVAILDIVAYNSNQGSDNESKTHPKETMYWNKQQKLKQIAESERMT